MLTITDILLVLQKLKFNRTANTYYTYLFTNYKYLPFQEQFPQIPTHRCYLTVKHNTTVLLQPFNHT